MKVGELEITLEPYERIKIKSLDDGSFIDNQSVTNVLLYAILVKLEELNESNRRQND